MSNLEKVLNEFSIEFTNLLKSEIIKNDMMASGKLVNTLEVSSVVLNGSEYKVILKAQDYLMIIENGRKAGKQPPIANILNWIEVKKILPRPINGRDITKCSLAYLIARHIGKSGIPAKHLISKTFDQLLENYEVRIREAIVLDEENKVLGILQTTFANDPNVIIKKK